mgnify:CR=1 FL=1
MINNRILWYLLVFLQIIIYSSYFIDYLFENISTYIFIFSMATSASICFLLTYFYCCYKKNKSYTKKDIVLIIIMSWFGSVLLILPVLLFGYIIIVLFLIWYLYTTLYLGIKYVFKRD